MARRVLYLSSLTVFILVMSCNQPPPGIPAVYVLAEDARLQQHEGHLYYDGKLFSGHIYSLYTKKDTAMTTPYLNGREEGWAYQWYPSGAKMEDRFYTDGRKQGKHSGYWSDGKPKFLYHFEKDLHEGEAQDWYSDGRLYRDFHYYLGQEEGRQQLWWPDGRVRANYIVKEGEQYGLIGRKLCKNPVHETN